MNTLIYHYGALGDFITILPVVSAIKRQSDATITLLGKPSHGRFGIDARQIDVIIDADGGSCRHLFLDNAEERVSREFFAPFDAIIIFATSDSPIIANARRFSRTVPLHQQPFPGDSLLHITDYHLSLLPLFAGNSSDAVPSIGQPDELTACYRKKYGIDHRPYVVIHPGSGSTKKNWPLDRYLNVAKTMRRHGFIIRWLTGPAETPFDVPKGDHHFAAVTLTEATVILASCSIYIGNDSGITHLAAASGCPVVALFGPSDPAVWGPRGHGQIEIIQHLPDRCTPCHRKPPGIPHCTGTCLANISSNEVSAAALSLASERP